MNTPSDLITSTVARRLLGISTWKMAQLLKNGRIRHYPDPLDERKKLVSKAEVESLKINYAEAA